MGSRFSCVAAGMERLSIFIFVIDATFASDNPSRFRKDL